jgi:hypothetical protein
MKLRDWFAAKALPHALAEELSRANADQNGRKRRKEQNGEPQQSELQAPRRSDSKRLCSDVADASCELLDGTGTPGTGWRGQPSDSSWWFVEPDMGRVAHGIPARVDRLKGLGNAVVPQIPEIIGRAIMSASELLHDKRQGV